MWLHDCLLPNLEHWPQLAEHAWQAGKNIPGACCIEDLCGKTRTVYRGRVAIDLFTIAHIWLVFTYRVTVINISEDE